MIDKQAFSVFNSEQIVTSYAVNNELQESELSIYESYKDKINNSVFLDLGIGTGRTTQFFYPKCKKYYGIDVSPNMIQEAQKSLSITEELFVGDARNLSFLESSTVDVVLFSFNGIDYLNFDDRKKVFEEVNRVLKPNGLFIFSTHNSKSIINLLKFPNFHVFKLYSYKLILSKLFFLFKFFAYNHYNLMKFIFENKFALINDGVYNFRLKTFYVNLNFQEKQLMSMGFDSINQYSFFTGEKMNYPEKKITNAPWVYFTCLKNKVL